MIFAINNLKYDTDKMELISDKCQYWYKGGLIFMKYIIAKIIEFAAICAVAIILIKMGYGGETWQYWVILVLMTVYGGAFACEKDKEELE